MRSNSLSLHCFPGLHSPSPGPPRRLPARDIAVLVPLAQLRVSGRDPPPVSLLPSPLCLPGTTKPTSTRIRSGMSTGSLTTWWLRSSSLQAASCGPARTTMETCSRTSWRRVRWACGRGLSTFCGWADFRTLLVENFSSVAAGLGLANSLQDPLWTAEGRSSLASA